jgi:hypothetical protein
MKTHTTSTLRSLVDRMHPKNQMSVQEIETWIAVLPDITQELAAQMKFFVYSIFNKSLVKRHLQQMQAECTSLLNAVDKFSDFTGDMLTLKNHTLDCLNSTLDRLMNHYQSYTDLTGNMTIMHFRIRINSVKSNLDRTKGLMEALGIEADLKVLILECINKLIACKTASYELVNYVANFQLDLNDLLSHSSKEHVKAELHDFLCGIHYNSELFIQFLIKQYQLETEMITDLRDKQSYLIRKRERLRKQKATPRKPKYLGQQASIYDRLVRSIDTEIKCLDIAILKAKPKRVPIKAPVRIPYHPVDYKLRFNFSVDCLAYLIKLMVNANIIDPGVKAELERYVATNFRTPGTKSTGMSSASFHTKYKNVTQSTSVTVKAGLMSMLKLIDKEF